MMQQLNSFQLFCFDIIAGNCKDILYMTKHDLRFVLTLFEHCDIFVCPISESMPKSLALQQKYASLFHNKKCSTQYVAHFIWLTNSLKIGEYATICSTLYVLPIQLGASRLTLY